ncbi:MAG: exodeoxyribonuclease VII large subunit [Simkaniaceae bacterium]
MTAISEKIFTVTELTGSIKKILESQFPSVKIQGEISNLRMQSSGHVYFSLKDQNSQISAVLFKGHAQKMPRLPKIGDQVVILGDINVYMPRGAYQIVVRNIEYSGLGALLLKLHQLKEKLGKLGWLDPEKKQQLPKFPKVIGVVTSPSGSVIQDIIHVLQRRFDGFQLILNPVAVQGAGAEREIAKAIYDFNRYGLADVLIVGRGGGSLEDLWPFNEECVAKAIYESKIPIISAVGHETDYSIADFVADVRAPTPSAAAEIAAKEKKAQMEFLQSAAARLAYIMKQKIMLYKARLAAMEKNPYIKTPYSLLGPHIQKIDEKKESLAQLAKQWIKQQKISFHAVQTQIYRQNPQLKLKQHKAELKKMQEGLINALNKCQKDRIKHFTSLQNSLLNSAKIIQSQFRRSFDESSLRRNLYSCSLAIIARRREKLHSLVSHLTSIDPKNLLKKGYCIPFKENKDSIIMGASDLMPNDKLNLLFHDGWAESTVDQIIKENQHERQ